MMKHASLLALLFIGLPAPLAAQLSTARPTMAVLESDPEAEPPPTTSDVERPSAAGTLEHCPEPSRRTFVLEYDASAQTLEPVSDGSPTADQRVVVCVRNADYRDTLDVLTSDPRAEIVDVAAMLAEGAETELDTEAVATGALDRSSAALHCGGREVMHALSWLESQRLSLLRDLRDALSGDLGPTELASLRDRIAALGYPNDSSGLCTQTTFDGRLALVIPNVNCSLEQYVTNYLLPVWISVVESSLFVAPERFRAFAGGTPGQAESAATCSAAIAAATGTSGDANAVYDATLEQIEGYLVAIEHSLRRTVGLVRFAEQVIERLTPPAEAFDIGSFSGGRLVRIEVRQRRQNISFDGSMARLTYREHRVSTRLEIHGVEFFRVEPGFAFSFLQQPSFEVISDPFSGDQVIAQRGDGLDIFMPAVFASFYWCGLDVRPSPTSRVCADVDEQWLRDLLPKLPSITIGIPINSSLVNGTANFFIGGLVNLIPYVSVGAGVHLGLNVNQLRTPYRLGDPVPAGTPSASLTQETVQAGFYMSLSIAPDAFAALSGFRAE